MKSLSRNLPPVSCRAAAAFSLVELLTVISLMALLSSISVATWKNLARPPSPRDAAREIVAVLDLARSRAISRNTYIWVAFAETGSSSPGDALVVGVLESANGRPVTVPQNLRAAESMSYRGTRLGTASSAGSDAVLDTDLGSLQVPFEGATLPSRGILRFGPMGEAVVLEGKFSQRIKIALGSTTLPAGQAEAAIYVAGLSGRAQLAEDAR